MPRWIVFVCLPLVASAFSPAKADEGMWLLDKFPSDRVEKLYGFRPDQKWLDRVRLSAARLAHGCSAGFVSPRGLVQTNHHCVEECLEELSTSKKDLFTTGFTAKEEKDEPKCPDFELNQLTGIGDVTARVRQAIDGKEGEAFTEAKRAVKAAIAKECSGGDDALRCDVVELYEGGIYNLYTYRRFRMCALFSRPSRPSRFSAATPTISSSPATIST